MKKNLFIILSACVFFASALLYGSGCLAYGDIKINSVATDSFKGEIAIRGFSGPNETILLGIRDASDNLIYSIKSVCDSMGNWSGKFTQPLRTGKYYIQAVSQYPDGSMGVPVNSQMLDIKSPVVFIVQIFSALVIVLSITFVGGWYANKFAEARRSHRILLSQRDIMASYNVLRKDVEQAIKNLSAEPLEEGKINEARFLLKRINENLDKMSSYVIKGVKIIGKYDIDNLLKLK